NKHIFGDAAVFAGNRKYNGQLPAGAIEDGLVFHLVNGAAILPVLQDGTVLLKFQCVGGIEERRAAVSGGGARADQHAPQAVLLPNMRIPEFSGTSLPGLLD